MSARHASRFGARGFSLVELLVVLAVMGVLAVAAIPAFEVSAQRSRETELRRALWEIRDAIDAHKRAADAGQIVKVGEGYPTSLRALAEGVPGRAGDRRVFLRRVPRDPFAPAEWPAERTWKHRSYASTPHRPQAGDDVYDVSTMSDRLGLNGIPLAEW